MNPTPLRRRGAIAAVPLVAAPLAGLALAAAATVALGSQDAGTPPPGRGAPPTATPDRPAPGQPDMDLAGMLLQGLRSTPGCLKAEAAQWTDGKASIVGWFEDRAAAMRWYEHPMHRRVMGGMRAAAGEGGGDRPMADVPPDVPLMILATITPSDRPEVPGFPGPISQISIELFTPVPGGAALNGRLSPEGFAVEGLEVYDAPEGDRASPPTDPRRGR